MMDIRKLVETYVDYLKDQRSYNRTTPTWMIQNLRIHGKTAEAVAYEDGLRRGYKQAQAEKDKSK